MCIYMLEEHTCLILTSKAEKKPLIHRIACTESLKHDDIEHCVYRWQMNLNTEIYLSSLTQS